MDFFKCSFQKVYDCVKHHSLVLSRASEIRQLEDFEIEFMSLIPLLLVGSITKKQFRCCADKYFNN